MAAPSYFTETTITPNTIYIKTMIGANVYCDHVNRSLTEDIELGTLATKYKVVASVAFGVDANAETATSRIAKNTADAAR